MVESTETVPARLPTIDGWSYVEALTGSPPSGSKWDRSTGDVNPEMTKIDDKPLTLANDFVNEVDEKTKQTHVAATTRPPTNKQKRTRWTKVEQVDLYRSYCKAKLLKLSLVRGTYEIWRKRNPTSRPHINENTLSTQRSYVENNSLTEIEIESIWESVKAEVQTDRKKESDADM